MRLVTVVSGPGLLRWSSNARGSPFRVSTISRRGRTLPAKYPLNPRLGGPGRTEVSGQWRRLEREEGGESLSSLKRRRRPCSASRRPSRAVASASLSYPLPYRGLDMASATSVSFPPFLVGPSDRWRRGGGRERMILRLRRRPKGKMAGKGAMGDWFWKKKRTVKMDGLCQQSSIRRQRKLIWRTPCLCFLVVRCRMWGTAWSQYTGEYCKSAPSFFLSWWEDRSCHRRCYWLYSTLCAFV